jgi:hypothetical protein
MGYLDGARDAIAAALSTVAGVTGYSYKPVTPKAGDAWPLWAGGERGPGRSFQYTWRVLILLPKDERAASAWIDEHVEALVDAMEGASVDDNDVGFVDRLDPVAVTAGGTDQLALQITMRE